MLIKINPPVPYDHAYDLCVDIGLLSRGILRETSIFAICEGSFSALINIGHFGPIHQLSTNDQAAD